MHKRLVGIQILRALSILTVVWIHLTIIERKYGADVTFIPSWLTHAFGGIDIFFVISGLMMVLVTRGQFHSVENALRFAFDRIVRIYPLYWLFTTSVLVVYLINPKLVNSAQENRIDLLASYLLLPSDLVPLINVAWMLVHVLYFYFTFTLFLLLLRENHLAIALGGWAILVTLGQFYCFFSSCGATLNLVTHPHTFEFIAGCYIGILYRRHFHRFGLAAFVAGTVLLVGGIIYLSPLPAGQGVSNWNRVSIFGLPATLIVYGVTALEAKGSLVLPARLQSLGDASYSIYLSHVPILTLLGRVWSWFSSRDLLNHLVALSLMLSAVIWFGIFSYRLIEKPMLQKLHAWGDLHLPKVIAMFNKLRPSTLP